MSSDRDAGQSGGPGQSGPGEPGYEGEVSVGEEGGHPSSTEDELVDEASEDSFPASDPPASSETT